MAKRRSDEVLGALVAASKGCGHPARLRMLAMLAEGELCVCQMTAVLGLAPSTVSEHLAVLERGGLVEERKEGRLVFYRRARAGVGMPLLDGLLATLAGDAQVRQDASVVARLRRVPVAELCAAELDLVAVGIPRPTGTAEGGR